MKSAFRDSQNLYTLPKSAKVGFNTPVSREFVNESSMPLRTPAVQVTVAPAPSQILPIQRPGQENPPTFQEFAKQFDGVLKDLDSAEARALTTAYKAEKDFWTGVNRNASSNYSAEMAYLTAEKNNQTWADRNKTQLELAQRQEQLALLNAALKEAQAKGDFTRQMELLSRKALLDYGVKSALNSQDIEKLKLEYGLKGALKQKTPQELQIEREKWDQERVMRENEARLSYWERVNKVQQADRAYALQLQQYNDLRDSARMKEQVALAQTLAAERRNREILDLERRKYEDSRADYLRNWQFQQAMLRAISGGTKGGFS